MLNSSITTLPNTDVLQDISDTIKFLKKEAHKKFSFLKVIWKVFKIQAKFRILLNNIELIEKKSFGIAKPDHQIWQEIKDQLSVACSDSNEFIAILKDYNYLKLFIKSQEEISDRFEEKLEAYQFVGDSEANDLMNEIAELATRDSG